MYSPRTTSAERKRSRAIKKLAQLESADTIQELQWQIRKYPTFKIYLKEVDRLEAIIYGNN